MALVNIPRNRDDPNYRYKMPRMISKIEGRGNGIKTNIANMGDIAKSLKRPPMYVTKFFGCELGAMAKFEDAEEKAIINGAHNEKDLTTILDKFIEMYVLCMGCHLPEIDMNVKKGALNYKCNACGSIGMLDCAHKAATYMIRNPPDNKDSTLGKKKKSKEERRADKIKKQQSGQVDSEEEDALKKKKEKKEKEEDKKEKKKKKKKSKEKEQQSTDEDSVNQSDEINENTSSSPNSSDDKEKERLNDEKSKSKKKISKSACGDKLLEHEKLKYDSDEILEVVNRMRNFIESNEKVSVEDFFREIRVLQVSQDFDAKCRVFVALRCLFNEGMTVADLEAKLPYICRVVDSSTSSFDVLNAFEHFCYVHTPQSLPVFPYFVQKLYGAEILDSEDILKHYEIETDVSSFNGCKKTIQPFLTWLRENESEEESSEEETEEVKNVTVRTKSLNLHYNKNNRQSSDNFTSASTTPNTTKGGEYEEEEFHDAVEENEEEEIKITPTKILQNDRNYSSYKTVGSNDDDDFDIDDI